MRNRSSRVLLAAVVVTLVAAGCASDDGGAARGVTPESTPSVAGRDMATAFGRLPLRFEPNMGEPSGTAGFVARAPGYTALVGPTDLRLSIRGAEAETVGMRLDGADAAATARHGKRLEGVSNYLSGPDPADWVLGVSGYGSVTYAGAYPGIDVVYRGARHGLEYDFVVAPGADPGQITLVFDRVAEVDERGDLVLETSAGTVRHEEPVVYQEIDGKRRTVDARYVVESGASGSTVRFRLGRFDSSVPLVIDPAVVYSTFLGGPLGDAVNAIAVDGGGHAYVTGSTTSTDFPRVNALQAAKGAGATSDAFVTKLNPAGNGLVYSTYLGGGAADEGFGIAVDGAGNAYVAGSTASTNFPVANAFQATKGAGTTTDAFVAKLDPAGSALVFSTYLGGAEADAARAIALDAAGDAYVAGAAASTGLSTAGVVQPAKGTGTSSDAFAAKVSSAGVRLWSTYLGGAAADQANGLAVDAGGNAYVAGFTASSGMSTAGSFQQTKGAGATNDAFVTKLAPDATTRVWSTYLGGALADAANAIALDSGASPYVTGSTASTDFPTASPIQGAKASGPEVDVFVTKLAPTGASLVYSTYLGGVEEDQGKAIAVDATGSAHFSGIASSELFPVERPVARNGGNTEAFVARLTPAGTSFVYSTHYGGIGTDDARSIATDASQATYIGGVTTFAREPEYFPTVNAFQSVFGGGFVAGSPNSGDGFVAKFAPDTPGRPLVTRLTPRGGDTAGGTSVIIEGVGLGGATAVRFGDTPARSLTIQSDTRIVAVTPQLAEGIHKVTVTTGGGTSPANPVGEFWAGEGNWSLTGSLTTPRSNHTTTLLDNGKVLVAGGRTALASNDVATASAELYDPLTGTWSPTGSLATARWAHTATLLADGRVLVVGGHAAFSGALAFNSAELYNPNTGTWSPAANMAGPRTLHVAVRLTGPNCAAHCDKVLVAGGRAAGNSGTLDTSELYDPVRNVWEPAGNLRESRHTTEATVVGDGRVLIAGGFGPTNTAETFDPATATWSLVGPMGAARARPTVTRLPDGNALVNNGWNNGPVASSDIFDYRTNTFRPAGTPKTHRWNATAVVLPNGRVLALAGGVGGATAEIYDPKSNTFRSAGLLQFARGGGSNGGGGPGGTAVVLSSSTREFQADERLCGASCGKVLVVGNTDHPATELYTPAAPLGGPGYWLTASDGGVFAFGDAQFYGSTGAIRLNQPVVGMAATPSGKGYWLVASDGGVFAFGDAQFYGSTGAIRLNKAMVGMARTPTGKGYWLVASDGGVFAFGDAQFFGSTGAITLNRPVVGMAATPSGRGYWLTASDGGVFAFGDAQFFGSTGAIRLNQPVVGMAPTVNGRGYWLTASDGGVFAFGDAVFRGSTGAIRLNSPVVGMAATPSPLVAGYWLVAADGGVFAFGDAHFSGSTGAIRLNRPMVGMAPVPPPAP